MRDGDGVRCCFARSCGYKRTSVGIVFLRFVGNLPQQQGNCVANYHHALKIDWEKFTGISGSEIYNSLSKVVDVGLDFLFRC